MTARPRPRVLPNTLEYQLWLLPYQDKDGGASREEHARFAAAIADQIGKLLSRQIPYAADFAKIIEAAEAAPRKHYVGLSLELGTTTCVGIHRCLCIDVAARLLEEAEVQDAKQLQDVEAMVRSWSESEVEWMRGRLYSLTVEDAKIGKVIDRVVSRQ